MKDNVLYIVDDRTYQCAMNGNVTKRMMEREMYMKIISIRSILIRELNFSYNCTKPRDNGEENTRGFYHN